jgi:CheY-like chemotaxis protein
MEKDMRILAVDDDPIILELLAQFVEIMGEHKLMTALSGPEALEIIQNPATGPIDCFLLDLQMPIMDGVELAQKIRATSENSETPILMLTAMSDKKHVDAAFSAGATDYVTKPFEFAELTMRLGLAESQIRERKTRTGKIFASQAASSKKQSGFVELHEPIFIFDVENLINHVAMKNYLAQLARGSLFGSTTFAFTIRQIKDHHRALSAFDFTSLVADVAEVISDTLAGHQFLMSYAGGGTFLCVTESGWRPEMTVLMDAINLSLARIELYNSQGEQLYVRVSAGEAMRLIWKSESTIMDAVSAAYTSAEAASEAYERARASFWNGQVRA